MGCQFWATRPEERLGLLHLPRSSKCRHLNQSVNLCADTSSISPDWRRLVVCDHSWQCSKQMLQLCRTRCGVDDRMKLIVVSGGSGA